MQIKAQWSEPVWDFSTLQSPSLSRTKSAEQPGALSLNPADVDPACRDSMTTQKKMDFTQILFTSMLCMKKLANGDRGLSKGLINDGGQIRTSCQPAPV